MHRRLSVSLVAVAATASFAGLVVMGSHAAHAANGVFVYETSGGEQNIPFPNDDQCYKTTGATMGKNYSLGDAYLYTDDKCTIGKDAGNIPPFKDNAVPFESVRLRTQQSFG